MAGDWIKMRTSLLTDPKVNGIARKLEASVEASRALVTGHNGALRDVVTRAVTRHVTVSSLLVIWGAANEHTKSGVFRNADHSDIDDMVGIPGFGVAMESVGWLVYDPNENTITLPNFNEYNTSGNSRSHSAKSASQRQREYRERKASQEQKDEPKSVTESDVTRDVTSDVTRDHREEKRREDITPPNPHGVGDGPPGFIEFWKTWPNSTRKQARGKCLEVWQKRRIERGSAEVLAHVRSLIDSEEWRRDGGQFVPAPMTYLNQRRWEGAEDSIPAATNDLGAYV